MKIYNYDITLQEVPDEISLCISVCGCNLRCKDCHSKHTWDSGNDFTIKDFVDLIGKYKSYISCVCFFGGEWNPEELITMLKETKLSGLKTCLYTGLDNIDNQIRDNLDYLKTGRWITELGGLNSIKTNQIFLDIKQNKILNYKFIKND